MKYDFIRTLLKDVPEEDRAAVLKAGTEKHLELYCRNADGSYVLTERPEQWTDGSVYISAADREYAAAVMQETGLGQWLCPLEKAAAEEDPQDAAQREYRRKRRIGQIECLAVILAAFLLLLCRQYLGA